MDKLWYFTVSKSKKNYTHSHAPVKMCEDKCLQTNQNYNFSVNVRVRSHIFQIISLLISPKRRKSEATNSPSQSERTNTYNLTVFSLSLGHLRFFGFICDSNTRTLHSAACTFAFVFEFGVCQPTGSDLSGSLCVAIIFRIGLRENLGQPKHSLVNRCDSWTQIVCTS